MKFKLTTNVSNSESQSFDFSDVELSYLTDGVTDSGGVVIPAGYTMILECDLVNRYDVSYIKYYHSGVGDVSIYISESEDYWVLISSTSTSWGSYAEVGTYYPKNVKVVHSTASLDANVYEIEIYNNDSNILFGPAGSLSSYALDSYGSIVQEIEVFNNSTVPRDFYVFIDNTDNLSSDELLKVGTTSSGVFYTRGENSVSVPDSFSWDSGQHDGTFVDGRGNLAVSGTLSSGTYYSPVFDFNSYLNGRFFWEGVEDGFGSIDYPGSVDSEPCLGLRLHWSAPSGLWVDGLLSEDYDSLWSISVGSLSFDPTPNYSITEFRTNKYAQFTVTITGSAYINKVGIESPLGVHAVSPNSSGSFYVSTVSGTLNGQSSNIICWYKE